MGGEGSGEMCSCGKAEDADLMGIDVPFGGMLADEAECALGILQGGGGFGKRAGIGDAVFDEDEVHVDGNEPIADFGTFEVY